MKIITICPRCNSDFMYDPNHDFYLERSFAVNEEYVVCQNCHEKEMEEADINLYEAYCKIVVENFIKMQARTCEYQGEIYENFVVVWNSKDELQWKPMKPEQYSIDFFPASENGWDNKKTSLEYLKHNMKTYDDWKELDNLNWIRNCN